MAKLSLAAAQQVINSSDLPDPQKRSLNSQLQVQASIPDTQVYRYVVIFLGLAIFIPLIPILVMKDSSTAQMLLPIATGALGALAGLLAPSPAPN